MAYIDSANIKGTLYDIHDTAARDMIAPAYSTASAYAVGDYVTYNDKLYRCAVAIASGEAWTAAHWTAVNVGGEVGDLKSQTTALETYVRDMSPVATVGPADMVSVDDAAPLTAEGLVVNVEPVQAGSGDPSPTNVRPITGWDGVAVTDEGESGDTRAASVSFPETIYGGTVDLVTGECVVDRAMVDLGTLTWGLVSSGSFTPYFKANVSSLGIKYEGGFGTTAYRILSSMYKCVARSSVEFVDKTMCADGSSTNRQVTQIQIKDSAYSDATAFKAAMSGVQLVYELATPTTFTLTPAELELFKGVNNISADAGQVTVTYRQDVFLALSKRINELQALVVENG